MLCASKSQSTAPPENVRKPSPVPSCYSGVFYLNLFSFFTYKHAVLAMLGEVVYHLNHTCELLLKLHFNEL